MPDPYATTLTVNAGRTQRFMFSSRSPAATHQLGVTWGHALPGKTLVAITGPLGAGKTVLAGGLCEGLEVTDRVLSPTFVLEETLRGRVDVVHADLYRLEYESEVEELGLYEKADDGCVLLIEWADRYPYLYDRCGAEVRIVPDGKTRRVITVTCTPELAAIFSGGLER